ncbi:MAG: hypothetical protein WC224_06675, partial [Sphaerochaetaceae bacterium]
MATFTEGESRVLLDSIAVLEQLNSPFTAVVKSRTKDLETLAQIVERAPSPNTDLFNHSEGRTFDSLVHKLSSQGLSHVVNLPTKAVLGHGFIVSKLHLFGMLLKLLKSHEELEVCRERIEREYHDLLFTLMAEDLYTALINEQDIDEPWAKKAVHELIMMWDRRTSDYLEQFAYAIRELWQARHTVVPVLGTLLGTMEVMRLNGLLSPVWSDFLTHLFSAEGFANALEEFIFDLDYEEIVELRQRMREENLNLVSREQAWVLLEKEQGAENVNAAL